MVATVLCETTTLTTCDTELLSLLSPAYEAMIDCVPTDNELVLNVASPLAPSLVIPAARLCTEPLFPCRRNQLTRKHEC